MAEPSFNARWTRNRARAIALPFHIALTAGASADVPSAPTGAPATTEYGIEFITIGKPNNPPYAGNDPEYPGFNAGRGSVSYEYRIGRYEITTAQWMEFVNTFSTQGDEYFFFAQPSSWGATHDFSYAGPGRRWRLDETRPDPAMSPVLGIDWRTAARFVNWLNNGKSSDPATLDYGAYDASTFTDNPDGTFNDQVAHSPGARFWIPSLDEWLKAAHFDPNRFGSDQPGWWLFSHRSDDPPVPGLPGQGQTSASLTLGGFAEKWIPLGAYSGIVSPWGLYDTSGGATEWLEEVSDGRFRLTDGASAGLTIDSLDRAALSLYTHPGMTGTSGLRLAGLIPSPSCVSLTLVSVILHVRRRRRDA